ncbi:hypothetical protein Indivirus_7_2 [Indivirus ILV1]|uniref:Uncharacterized protein n=1 Tax=Indivirus ILV1 TaxID=1977633 RepID=A0A1V0SE49_9VIRU|nr:hypothetical protein Indivirus_7_2 [Indivirus ILV1]
MNKIILFLGLLLFSSFCVMHYVYTNNEPFTKTLTMKSKFFSYIFDYSDDIDVLFYIRDTNNNDYRVTYALWMNMEINKTYDVIGYRFMNMYDYIHTAKITEKLEHKFHKSV